MNIFSHRCAIEPAQTAFSDPDRAGHRRLSQGLSIKKPEQFGTEISLKDAEVVILLRSSRKGRDTGFLGDSMCKWKLPIGRR